MPWRRQRRACPLPTSQLPRSQTLLASIRQRTTVLLPPPTPPPHLTPAPLPPPASCPNQTEQIESATTLAPGGEIKDRVCGYCLNQTQRVGLLAVPGTTGAAIALMLLLAILMMFPAARKGSWFKCFTLFIAIVSIVFLIAAVSAGYVMTARCGPVFVAVAFDFRLISF
jgi:hypothetical protein